jgi:surface antigen
MPLPTRLLLLLALLTPLGACTTDRLAGRGDETPATVGAVPAPSVPVRGPGTGLIGESIAGTLDGEDRGQALKALYRALEEGRTGAPVGWRNSETGRYGSVVPGPSYVEGGRTCREYSHTAYSAGRPMTIRAVACRSPDGTWAPAG